MAISACTCVFRRTKDDKLESGIAIATAPGYYHVVVIVDAVGEMLTKAPYHYELTQQYGCFVLPEELAQRFKSK